MSGSQEGPVGPDLSAGVPLSELRPGEALVGHLGEDAVMLVRTGEEVRAIGATCTHYGGPLAEGLIDGDRVVCPWHHACFSLRTGEAVAAPALNPVATWDVEVRDGRVHLGSKREESPLSSRGRSARADAPVVIIGSGAAGSAAAEQLRREGFEGDVVLVDPDADAPYDRPNLSKDYLAGNAPEEWIPLRPPGFHEEHGIRRVIARAERIDRERARVVLDSGAELEYGALLLATGATPRRLNTPGADAPHVHLMRSLADTRAIIAQAQPGRSALVVGVGFIGMEAASSLKQRGLDVAVVAPDAVPFERVLGPELGAIIQRAHEEQGVRFHLGRTVARFEPGRAVLDDGTEVAADLVLIGIGVAPDTRLAEAAGLSVDNGVLVDEQLRTDDPRIWVAGDSARWLDRRTGQRMRVEHWVVAQRQGQAAARNIVGRAQPFDDVPFFWTRQFDVGVNYVGHAIGWDRAELTRGDGGTITVRYLKDGVPLAVATVNDDRASLEAERAFASGGMVPA